MKRKSTYLLLLTFGLLFQGAKPAEKTIRFVSFGDFGTGARIQYKVAQAIENKCRKSGCDFALTLGDNIYNNGVKSIHDTQFQSKFEKPYARLDFPFYMALGNHDYRGNVEAQIAYTQHSKKWLLPSRYYHFETPQVTFLALDTNRPNQAQSKHFKQVLKHTNTPWNIAFGHHPRFTYSAYKNTQSPDLKRLIDGFCGKVDFYLSGHEHDKQHIKALESCGTEYLIVGTGAGLRMVGKGPRTLFAKSSFGFAWFEINARKIHFEIYDHKGNKEYEYTRLKS